MKKLEAVIRAADLDSLKDVLAGRGVRTIVAVDVTCVGESIQQRVVYRGTAYITDTAAGLKLELAVPDEGMERVIAALVPAVERGPAPDLGILVTPCLQVPVRGLESSVKPSGTPDRVQTSRQPSERPRSRVAAAVEWIQDSLPGPGIAPSF